MHIIGCILGVGHRDFKRLGNLPATDGRWSQAVPQSSGNAQGPQGGGTSQRSHSDLVIELGQDWWKAFSNTEGVVAETVVVGGLPYG